jgi:hypothetical protein
MRRRSAARPVALLTALVAALVLAGCARIPMSGPVTEGRSGDDDTADVRVIAREPARGMSPQEIVSGFLLAVGNAESDYATARTYLTKGAGARWRPDAGTVVYSRENPGVDVVADGRAVPSGAAVSPDVREVKATVSASEVATIDDHGRYTVADPGARTRASFTLTRDDQGQWRIAGLEDGLLVAESFLGLEYRAYDLYFLDPSHTTLVPETRWFPRRESNATVLARELLAGPSPWLAAGVRSAFPPGTQLAPPGSVRVEEGVANVDLTSSARDADPRDRGLMLAQLSATLRPVDNVNTVTITVGGSEIDVPKMPPSLMVDPAVETSPVLVKDGGLLTVSPGGTPSPVEGLPDLRAFDLARPAMSPPVTQQPGPRRYAVLAAERSQLYLLSPGEPDRPSPVLVAPDLTAPSFDPYGFVWSTAAVSRDSVTAVSPSGDVVTVAAPWLSGRRIVSLRASRDGTRVLVASTDADGLAHLEVAGVERRADDLAPVRIGPDGPLEIKGLERVDDAVWIGDLEIAALGRVKGEKQSAVHVLNIGAQAGETLAPVPGAVRLAGGNGEGQVLVGTSDGRVLEQAGSVWVVKRGTEGARDPAYAG